MDSWEKINLKDFMNDAPKMTVKQLARRYDLSIETVRNYCKRYNLNPKRIYRTRYSRANMEKGYYVQDMTDYGTIRPKYLWLSYY